MNIGQLDNSASGTMLSDTVSSHRVESPNIIDFINRKLLSASIDGRISKTYDDYLMAAGRLDKSVYEVMCEVEKIITYNDLRDIFAEVCQLPVRERIIGKVIDFNARYVKTSEGLFFWHPSMIDKIRHVENLSPDSANLFVVSKKVFDSLVHIDDSLLGNNDEDLSKIRADFIVVVKDALALHATDMHFFFAPGSGGVYKLFYRILGDLYEIKSYSLSHGRAFASMMINFAKECTPSLRIGERKRPQDARIFIAEDDLDLRLSILPKANNEDFDIVIRLLKKESAEDSSLERLGYTDQHCQMLRTAIQRTKGLVIFSGPTGSGKSRSVNTLLTSVRQTQSVYTIEDPIEYSQARGRQFQIFEWQDAITSAVMRTGFADYSRALKRHDPDVIFIGELRDKETVDAAIHLSKTGHLVFSTMHVSRATMIPEMLINDFGVDINSVADNLILGVNQSLVKTLDSCKIKSHENPPGWYSALRYKGKDKILARLTNKNIFRANPDGCSSCTIIKNSRTLSRGYSGRTVIAEVFEFMPEDFKDGKISSLAFEELFDERGVPNILDDAVTKILAGNMDYEIVRKLL